MSADTVFFKFDKLKLAKHLPSNTLHNAGVSCIMVLME